VRKLAAINPALIGPRRLRAGTLSAAHGEYPETLDQLFTAVHRPRFHTTSSTASRCIIIAQMEDNSFFIPSAGTRRMTADRSFLPRTVRLTGKTATGLAVSSEVDLGGTGVAVPIFRAPTRQPSQF